MRPAAGKNRQEQTDAARCRQKRREAERSREMRTERETDAKQAPMRSGFQCADAAKYEAAAESVCGGFVLQVFLFQMLDIAVDAVQFVRNLDVLGTVRHALVAADTAARLSETGTLRS